MAKDTRLINIYLKIHHKRTLTMDDLGYLAAYDPECFEKTCKNVIYKVPEIKSIMEPEVTESIQEESGQEPSEWHNIETLLKNLRHLEINDVPVENMDADKVKSLLGNLYMELLFPHNDQYAFVNMAGSGDTSLFDKKA